MLKVLLLGAIHQYQFESKSNGHFFTEDQLRILRGQREHYGRWVRECVEDFHPELIFDEMNLRESPPNERFTDTEVLWVYMDIPEEVRERFIPRRSRGEDWLYRIDEPRELHWLSVIENISAACGLKRVIAICGLAHLDPFSSKLRVSGHQVETKSIREQSWNDETWCLPATPAEAY